MSRRTRSPLAARPVLRRHAPVFAALGDETRLTLLARLCQQAPCSITQLAQGSPMTRQAITKHLRVLEEAHLVRSEFAGRESLFELEPGPLAAARDYLEEISQHWDSALARLKTFVEK
ncbi:MAG: metalloregulator ArsR/SmtB family transcription factor [Verrucomicrobiota bacterium]|nr:metalloregulator ArsR/SmtB family transcription factor [Verrucomicrobiota bacterium]